MSHLQRFRAFLRAFGDLVHDEPAEGRLLDVGGEFLADLVLHDDWLPDAYAQSDPERYRQYLLHCDSRERFSVVSFVWGPGHGTPIHDHRVWGLVGVLRGAEKNERFVRAANGALAAVGRPEVVGPGAVTRVSPTIGDIHRVSNAVDVVSVSIHVYGANIGAVERATYEPSGASKRFVSGYANASLPNAWGGGRP